MTNDTYALVYPMLAMFLWTFLILLRNVQVRVSAVLAWNYFTFRVGHGLVHLTLKLEKAKWRESSEDAEVT